MRKFLFGIIVLTTTMSLFLILIYYTKDAPSNKDLGSLVVGIWCVESGIRAIRDYYKEKELLK